MYLTGFKFWKVGSRKVYAIPEGDLRPKRAQRQIVISESESEDDFQQPVRKRFASTPSEGMPLPSKILSEVKHIRNDLKGLFQISAHMKIPPGLYRHLNDTFQCHICRSSPITPQSFFRGVVSGFWDARHVLTVGIEGRKGWLAAVHCADQKELILKQHHSKAWMTS